MWRDGDYNWPVPSVVKIGSVRGICISRRRCKYAEHGVDIIWFRSEFVSVTSRHAWFVQFQRRPAGGAVVPVEPHRCRTPVTDASHLRVV